MLFNSFEFVVFLPVVFFLYWFLFTGRKSQNALILISSYIFYGWWDWRFLLLIVLTSVSSFISGLVIEHYEGRRPIQKTASALNIILNLGILGVFKYYNFFVLSLQSWLNSIGYEPDFVTLQIILPVGISFYTFQALSYSIDVYRRKLPATHDPIEFMAYISFFPQLVAGPIERATNLLPQFQNSRQFDYAKAVDGMRQMLWGFLKKVVLADNCAMIVNEYWDNYAELPGISLIFIGILFSFQIYFDFSGYSDIAIGCSRLFGITLQRNFDFPYFSRSIPEFWRKWHISLMSWFRDYVYIPLGGSRGTQGTTIRNVFIVWAISGLWHGANWTFVGWGIYHAILLTLYILLGINTKYSKPVADGRWLPTAKETAQILLTFSLAVVGWILFRATSIEQACDYLYHMAANPFVGDEMHGLNMTGCLLAASRWFLWSFVFLAVEWMQRDKQHALQLENKGLFKHASFRYALYTAILLLIFFNAGKVQTFIYFQF
jgi:D-alanyl-lipoteichoic acid acyltransferase DltB (MBOAT superfamily)